MIQRVVVQELTSYTACLRIRSVLNYCCELLTESTGYEVLVGEFVLVEGYWLIWWYSGFFSSHRADEFPKKSCILSSVTGLHCSFPLVSV